MQDCAVRHGLAVPEVGVVLVGHRAMCDAARATFEAAGCPPEAIRLNF